MLFGGWIALTTVATTTLVVSCGSYDIPVSSGGFGGVAATETTARTTTPLPEGPCNETAAVGESCSSASERSCEQKTHANYACNGTLFCDGSRWSHDNEPEKTECALDCPTAFIEDLPDACAAPNSGTLICEYPRGTCGCASIRNLKGRDAGDGGDAGEDAGDVDESDAGPTAYVWTCVTPDAGCPRTRPQAGTTCVRPLTCAYGDCLFEDGVSMSCSGGTWKASVKRCDR
jgi:hypothetical protein